MTMGGAPTAKALAPKGLLIVWAAQHDAANACDKLEWKQLTASFPQFGRTKGETNDTPLRA